MEASKASTPGTVIFGYRVSSEGNDDATVPPPDEVAAQTSGDRPVQSQVSFEERLAAAFNNNKGPIDWMSVRVRTDLPPSPDFCDAPYGENQSTLEGNFPSLTGSETVKFMKLYFTHFHHRWPILHAPTFEAETAPPVLLWAVTMIGACIHGTTDSKELAMNFHTRVDDYILPRLVCPSH